MKATVCEAFVTSIHNVISSAELETRANEATQQDAQNTIKSQHTVCQSHNVNPKSVQSVLGTREL